MIRRKSTVLSLITLLCASMVSTLFIYMTYANHFDSVADEFSGLFVIGPSDELWLPGDNADNDAADEKFVQMVSQLETWASDHEAVLFYKGINAAGIAAIDYAGWFDENFHISFTGQVAGTVIVQTTREYVNDYLWDQRLFPDAYNYEVVGEFGDRNIPTFQGDAFFYYPLRDITALNGLLFTNIVAEQPLQELIEIIQQSGRSADFQTLNEGKPTLRMMLYRMFSGDMISRTMFFAFLGIVFCTIFAISMWYRESYRYLFVHHLYGATYYTLFIKLLLFVMFIALVGTLWGYALARAQLNLFHQPAYKTVAVLSGVMNILFVTVVHAMCFIQWKRGYRNESGAY